MTIKNNTYIILFSYFIYTVNRFKNRIEDITKILSLLVFIETN